MTNARLGSRTLVPNTTLRRAITAFVEARPELEAKERDHQSLMACLELRERDLNDATSKTRALLVNYERVLAEKQRQHEELERLHVELDTERADAARARLETQRLRGLTGAAVPPPPPSDCGAAETKSESPAPCDDPVDVLVKARRESVWQAKEAAEARLWRASEARDAVLVEKDCLLAQKQSRKTELAATKSKMQRLRGLKGAAVPPLPPSNCGAAETKSEPPAPCDDPVDVLVKARRESVWQAKEAAEARLWRASEARDAVLVEKDCLLAQKQSRKTELAAAKSKIEGLERDASTKRVQISVLESEIEAKLAERDAKGSEYRAWAEGGGVDGVDATLQCVQNYPAEQQRNPKLMEYAKLEI